LVFLFHFHFLHRLLIPPFLHSLRFSAPSTLWRCLLVCLVCCAVEARHGFLCRGKWVVARAWTGRDGTGAGMGQDGMGWVFRAWEARMEHELRSSTRLLSIVWLIKLAFAYFTSSILLIAPTLVGAEPVASVTRPRGTVASRGKRWRASRRGCGASLDPH
jgi:hypothetical protein